MYYKQLIKFRVYFINITLKILLKLEIMRFLPTYLNKKSTFNTKVPLQLTKSKFILIQTLYLFFYMPGSLRVS